MKRFFSILTILAVLLPAQEAMANSLQIRLVAVVPGKCISQVTGKNMRDSALTLSVNRTCNTHHRMRVSNTGSGAQDVLVRYQNRTYPLRANASINIPTEPATDAVDTIAIQPVKNATLSASYSLGVQLIPST